MSYVFKIAAMLLLLTALPAYAGSLTWVVTTGSDTAPTVTAPKDGTSAPMTAIIADADISRIVAAYATIPGYQQIPATNKDGSPQLDKNSNPIMRDTDVNDVTKLIIANILTGMLANVANQEKATAMQKASQSVSTIVATPQ